MITKITVRPKFNVQKIYAKTIGKEWNRLQIAVFRLGKITEKSMKDIISRNTKRSGFSGRLRNSMTLYRDPKVSKRIFWGIGPIATLNKEVPYWYVVNYGKTVSGKLYVPNHGNFIPGFFGTPGQPDASKGGQGTDAFVYAPNSGFGMRAKQAIRPMNYIQKTNFRLRLNLAKTLRDLTVKK